MVGPYKAGKKVNIGPMPKISDIVLQLHFLKN